MTVTFQHALRLARIENDYLKSIFALFAKLNSPILKEIFSQFSLNERILMDLENPENKGKFLMIESQARLTAIRKKINDWIKALKNLKPLLEELVDKQIDINDETLTSLDLKFNKLNDEISRYLQLEDETAFLYELSVETVLNELHDDFSLDRERLELALQDSSDKTVKNLFEEYSENLNNNNSKLINFLQKLTSVIEVSPLNKKDIYLAVANIEKHYLFKLLSFLMETSNSDNPYLRDYYDFMELTSPLNTKDSLLELEDVMSIRHDMGLVHDTIIASLMSYGIAKKDQISSLSDVVEAKNNLQTMANHEIIWLGYNFFDANKLMLDGAKAGYSFFKAGREFKKSRSRMERWLASTEMTEVEQETTCRQLEFYETRLIENLKSIENSWAWFADSPENKMEVQDSSKKRQHPQADNEPAQPIKKTFLLFDESAQKSSKVHVFQIGMR